MLKRLEDIEKYLAYVRQNIEHDKEILGLDPEQDDDSIVLNDSNNGEFLNSECQNGFDNNINNSNGAHVLTENLINIGNCESNGNVSSSSAIVAPVYYRSVRLQHPTEEELLKWDLYRNQDGLPFPWTFFKLNKSVYRPPENILDDFDNGQHLPELQREPKKDKNVGYDENLHPKHKIMNNNLNNNNNNNLNKNLTDPKTNPWKAREGNVSDFFDRTVNL